MQTMSNQSEEAGPSPTDRGPGIHLMNDLEVSLPEK